MLGEGTGEETVRRGSKNKNKLPQLHRRDGDDVCDTEMEMATKRWKVAHFTRDVLEAFMLILLVFMYVLLSYVQQVPVHMIETPAFQGFQLNELLGTDSPMTRNTSQKVKPHAFAFWAAFLYCSPFGDYISPGKAVVCVSARQSCSFCLSLLTVQLGLRMLPQKVRPIAEAREKVPSRAEELGHCRGGTWPSQDSHCLHLYIAQLCTVLPCCRREPRAMWLRRQHTLLHLTRSSARRCDIIKRITDGITSPDNTEEKQT